MRKSRKFFKILIKTVQITIAIDLCTFNENYLTIVLSDNFFYIFYIFFLTIFS